MKNSVLAVCAIAVCGQVSLEAQPRLPGDSRLFAAVPAPGYPEGIVVHGNRVYVSGPAAFGAGTATAWAYELNSGALVDTITILDMPAASCLTADNSGMLYVLVPFVGVVRIEPVTHDWSMYATGFGFAYTSQFSPPAFSLLNDLAFDSKGNLYVTDTFQATIWRVPPGGGPAQVWFKGAQIDGPFGPNGIRVHPKQERLYFAVTTTATGEGKIFTLPLVDAPTAADLKVFATYAPGGPLGFAGPDGIAFGKSGQLYVALAGSSQISILSPVGKEMARYSGPAKNMQNPSSPLAWANPANIAFDDSKRTIMVTNHASLVNPIDPNLFAIFDVQVNDKAGKLFGDPDGEN